MVNRYAEQVEAGNCATIWVCQCCMLSHANGECCASDDHGGDGRVPLSLIPATADLSMGSPEGSERLCGMDSDVCECGVVDFSITPCEGCGSSLAGERHAMFVVYDMRVSLVKG